MALRAVERRRIALLSDQTRFDVALGFDETLDDALALTGLSTGGGLLTVIGPGGVEVPGDTVCEDLEDGGLYSLVDLSAVVSQRRPGRRAMLSRVDHGARWWLLGVCALVLLAALAITAGNPVLRLVIGLLLAIGAVGGALAWSKREANEGARGALGILAPVLLAFAAGATLVPAHLESAGHLSTASGFLAVSVITAVVALTGGAGPIRAAGGTATVLLVSLAAVWGVTLLLQWGPVAAAAISVGLVPLGLRALPSSLVNLPEGYFIDYKHFMSSRWTVRGAIPETRGAVRARDIVAVVDESSARLVAGTIVLSVVAAIMMPFAILRPWPDNPFVVAGGVALLVCTELSLLLTPRHTTSRILRWMPRAAAAVVLVCAVIQASAAFSGDVLVLGAAVLFVVGLIAVAVAVPMSRGTSSLGWSRVGDAFEWLAVALALPAALLYADALSTLRGMMSG